MQTDTIQKTFGLSDAKVSGYRAHDFVVGIELEIEANKENTPICAATLGWQVDKDGSLRNDGRELISPPIPGSKAKSDFEFIHRNIKLGKNPFTERTSIHVHVNCMYLTQKQVKNILLWYNLFEPIFFTLVDTHRRHNIHCVPLEQTVVSGHFKRALPVIVGKWSKYSALNLLPLQEYGTIEFRHMDGHNSVPRFNQWLTIIERLWTLGVNEDFNRKTLDTMDIKRQFLKIFAGTDAEVYANNLEALTASTLVDVKFAVI